MHWEFCVFSSEECDLELTHCHVKHFHRVDAQSSHIGLSNWSFQANIPTFLETNLIF